MSVKGKRTPFQPRPSSGRTSFAPQPSSSSTPTTAVVEPASLPTHLHASSRHLNDSNFSHQDYFGGPSSLSEQEELKRRHKESESKRRIGLSENFEPLHHMAERQRSRASENLARSYGTKPKLPPWI